MAFKRSAVRSRLSPPYKSWKLIDFQGFFLLPRKLLFACWKLLDHIADHIGCGFTAAGYILSYIWLIVSGVNDVKKVKKATSIPCELEVAFA